MPEIKHSFQAGRMNQDLDERLVPNGEYREALNVEVTTSEGSDVGTVQTTMGNTLLGNIDLSPGSKCIGKIANEKNDKLYWFISAPPQDSEPGQLTQDLFIKDIIAEYDYQSSSVNPVAVDLYKVILTFNSINSPVSANQLSLNTVNGIRVGMKVTGRSSSAQTFTSEVASISGSIITLTSNIVFGATIEIIFEAERVLNFNQDFLITGVNIIDNLLFWTDNNSEPKRLNIDRYRDVGSVDFNTHSNLPIRDTSSSQLAYIPLRPFKEEDITVIRRAPLTAPVLEMKNTPREGAVAGMLDYSAPSNTAIAAYNPFWDYGASEMKQTAWIEFGGPGTSSNPGINQQSTSQAPDYQINDILEITVSGSNPEEKIRAKVISGPDPVFGSFEVSILSADPAINSTNYIFDVILEQPNAFFEFKFPRFGLRYKYENGEYSPFSPFSEIAFLPEDFDYLPKKGYNLGMVNNIRRLVVRDFVPELDLLPDDVIEIDILYKESDSPNIYSVKTVKKDDDEWVATGPTSTATSGVRGYVKIESEMIHATLPSNQLLRPWDNVPRKALAQEVTGNRIVYGNYLQNYNLLDDQDESIRVNLRLASNSRIVGDGVELTPEQKDSENAYYYSPAKSIKSLRTYQLGIVYIDKYGRETPVFSESDNNTASLYTEKIFANQQTKLTAKATHSAPEFAKYFKYFIKETSNEYYNLALDRFYDAEDDNIWLSFPSSERNKVDEDTYLILKKEHDVDTFVSDPARYKVLAISNEAPEFVKTVDASLGTLVDTTTGTGPNGSAAPWAFGDGTTSGLFFPLPGIQNIYVNNTEFESLGWDESLIGQGKTDLWLRMHAGNVRSDWYKITSISLLSGIGVYDIKVDRLFEQDMAITSTDGTYANRNTCSLEVRDRVVENRPEFDGRFFVKVFKDQTLIDRIIKPQLNTTDYSVTQAKIVHYINPNTTWSSQNWHGWGAGINYVTSNPDISINYNVNPPANSPRVPTPLTLPEFAMYDTVPGANGRGKLFWKSFEDQSSGSRWFIDGRSGAGQVFVRYGTLSTWQTNAILRVSYSQPQEFATETIAASSTAVASLPSNNYANNVVESRGIYNNGTTIDLSALGFVGGNGTTADLSYNKFDIDAWGNSFVSDSNFINTLTTNGTLWKWKEDPDDVIYKTVASNVYDNVLFNTQAGCSPVSFANNFTTGSSTHYSYNRSQRWSFQAESLVGGNALGTTGPSYYLPTNDPSWVAGTVTAANPLGAAPGIRHDGMGNDEIDPNISPTSIDNGNVEWQILTPVDDTSLDKASNNPAVFETEPKEDVGLDIYYEVGQVYPITLDRFTNEMYIPIGSTVTTDGDPQTFPAGSTVKVVAMNDNTATLDTNVNVNFFNQDDIFTFTRPDGSATTGKILTVSGGGNEVLIDPDIHKMKMTLPWFNCYSFGNGVESNRIRDDFNQVVIDKGVKASTTLAEPYEEERRSNGMIYSGIYNSVTGVNNLNQFIQAEKITKDLNPIYGSIQKLHSRNTDLITLCEDKVFKILANKDAVFNADGNPQLTANQNVLGQTIPFTGEYGISKNPESFASEHYRIYFTDKSRGAVLRLSMDGMTPISEYGMGDYFSDNLPISDKLIGSFDDNKLSYNLTITSRSKDGEFMPDTTISFGEDINGWSSFKSFIQENGLSLNNSYYTFSGGQIWQHHTNEVRNNYYGLQFDSYVDVLFNDAPGIVKSFNALNYEGSQSRITQDISVLGQPTSQQPGGATYTDTEYFNDEPRFGWYVDLIETNLQTGDTLEFKDKEDKWFAQIKGETTVWTDDGTAGNVDTSEFSVQGIGNADSITIPPASSYDLLISDIQTPGLLNNSNVWHNHASTWGATPNSNRNFQLQPALSSTVVGAHLDFINPPNTNLISPTYLMGVSIKTGYELDFSQLTIQNATVIPFSYQTSSSTLASTYTGRIFVGGNVCDHLEFIVIYDGVAQSGQTSNFPGQLTTDARIYNGSNIWVRLRNNGALPYPALPASLQAQVDTAVAGVPGSLFVMPAMDQAILFDLRGDARVPSRTPIPTITD